MPGESNSELINTSVIDSLSSIPKDHDTHPKMISQAIPLNGFTEHNTDEVKENALSFRDIPHIIDRLVTQIESGTNTAESRMALSLVLKAREKYYQDFAKIINPDIHPVEGADHLFRVGETDIYGSISAILDATPALAEHKKLTTEIGLKLPEGSAKVMGENIEPKALLQSMVVYSGSNAQGRVHPYAADIDLSEYVKIKAEDRKSAAITLAEALQASTKEITMIAGADNEKIALHLLYISLSRFQEGKNRGMRIQWSASDIQNGYKEIETSSGKVHRISLVEACMDPRMLSAEYIGTTAKDVFGVTKLIDITAEDSNNTTILSTIRNKTRAVQEVYFDDPSDFHLLDDIDDTDNYIRYVNAMKNEVREKTDPEHMNKMKMLKRLYNLYKIEGDVTNSQKLSEFFSSSTAAIYQLESRYKLARQAVRDNIMTGPQRDEIKSKLLSVLQNDAHPLAQEARTLLESPHIHQLYGKFHATIKRLTNAKIDEFLDSTPTVKQTITDINNT